MSRIGGNNDANGEVPNNFTVTTTSQEVLAADVGREWVVFYNLGNKDIFAAIGQTAEVNKGILIERGGGRLVLDAGFNSDQRIEMIVNAGTSLVSYQEGK